MKGLSIIACVSSDLGLGKGNDLLWRFKSDQQFFRKTTLGHPVVMGARTFASLNNQPLPGRENIVLTHRPLEASGVKVFSDKAALDEYLNSLEGEKFIIGGASLYKMYLPEAEKLILTEVFASKPADVFFPQFSPADYIAHELQTGEIDGHKYRIVEYLRRPNGD